MHSAPPHWRYWGKAQPPDEAGLHPWHPFAYHSLDVAAVAASLWGSSPAVRRALCAAFAVEENAAPRLRAWVLFFVALHDIGKLLALFQIKAPDAARLAWPDLDREALLRPVGGYHHGFGGFRLVKQDLSAWTGASGAAKLKLWRRWGSWVAAVTGHHGEIPDEIHEDRAPREYADQPVRDHDTAARQSWAEAAARLFLAPAGLTLKDSPPECPVPARALLAGFCSLCDWIGSNTAYFPYRPHGTPVPDYFADRVKEIERRDLLAEVGLVAPIRSFAGVTALLAANEHPRGVQVLVDRLPLAPSLTLVEAPTGSGKTEAALAHAWRLVESGAADSIVFALPTQATANAMLARAERFAECAYGTANLVLAHGNSRLNREYRRLVDAGSRRTAQGPQEASVHCAEWLASSRKRVFLGQIGICTVDQTLLSVLPLRHSFVRAFGLSRSVLIVDEVHAYDAYMNGLLGEVLRRQRATGGSAILLSATLPSNLRAELLAAWGTDGTAETAESQSAPYPVVWTAQAGAPTAWTLPEIQLPKPWEVVVELAKVPEARPDAPVIERILQAAEAGALVGVVMNTVDQAQALARRLRDETTLPVDLFHARYRLKDRQGIEATVIERYGRAAPRDGGRILVATQVIEQSLDLDFDWMISQLCPVDLLFQRFGRLHRHARPIRPDGFESPRCLVLAPEGTDYGVFELIYGDARRLWRTERLLAEQGRIDFPGAYRDWLEAVYGDAFWEDEPENISRKHEAYVKGCDAAGEEARRLTAMTVTQFRDDDEHATSLTRDGEMSLTILPLLPGDRLLDGKDLDGLDDHERAEALMLASVPAPRSWTALAARPADDDGRIRLEMLPDGPSAWASADGAWAYSVEFGLEKASAPGREDPAQTAPR